MIYSREFFDLQLRFAHRAATLTGLGLGDALLEYTNLYIRFGLGRDFKADHPSWRDYLRGVSETNDPREWTYRFYLERADSAMSHPVVATFGCFSYARFREDSIKLHFQNAEPEGHSPLAADRVEERRSDLRALFRDASERSDPPDKVVGASWLYNLNAYRRLFPPSYLATARPIGPHFQRMSLWGQLLDRSGHTKPDRTRAFVTRIEKASTVEELGRCFALQTLMPTAPLSAFRTFYEV